MSDNLFLLSSEEYKTYGNQIPKVNCYWWLRTQGYDDNNACEVVDNNYISFYLTGMKNEEES